MIKIHDIIDMTSILTRYNVVNYIEVGGNSIQEVLGCGCCRRLWNITTEPKETAKLSESINDPHCSVLCGISHQVLERIVPRLKEPTLFWLPENKPLKQELKIIMADRKARTHDVLLVGGLQYYEYVVSNRVPETPDINQPRSGFIYAILGPTHHITKLPNKPDTILATPNF